MPVIERSRCVAGLRRPDQARQAVVLLGRSRSGHSQVSGRPQDFWPNLNEGKAGFNYQPDRSKDRVEYTNIWRNVNARITWQASAEEQVQLLLGRTGLLSGSLHRRRLGVHVARVVVVERRSSRTACGRCRGRTRSRTRSCSKRASARRRSFSTTRRHRQFTNPIGIPRIQETGDTVGGRQHVAARQSRSRASPSPR